MKITLPKVNNINSLTVINSNFEKIRQELQLKVMYRDNPVGEPNAIITDVDVNNKNLFNVKDVRAERVFINGVAIGGSGGSTVYVDSPIASAAAVTATDAATAAQLSALSALGHSADAAASELNAVQAELSTQRFYPGSFVTDPNLRPDGSFRVIGDMAFNSTSSTWKRWSGTVWVAFDTSATTLAAPDGVLLIGNAADKRDLAASGGSALVGHLPAITGGLAMPALLKLNERVSLFDVMTTAQRTDWASGALALDHQAPLQALINACSSTTMYGAPKGIINRGRGKILSGLICPSEFIELIGDSRNSSQIVFDGVAASCITTAAMPYFRPILRDFNITGNTSSGAGLDFTNVSAQTYLGLLENLTIYSGGDCIKAPGSGVSPNFFSNVLRNIQGYSYNGHSFRIYSGPGNSFVGLYALRAAAGKAGFRMAGTVVLNSCNGLNQGDFWGVFGNDLTAADGFQTDFGATDYPDVTLIGCNMEEFSSLTSGGSAIVLHNGHRHFSILGGKIDRSRAALITAIPTYHSIIRARKGPNNSGNPIRLSLGSIFMGSSAATAAPLFVETGATISDENGSFVAAGITKYKNQAAGIDYPLLTYKANFDIYGDVAHSFNAVTARRISAQVIRFNELASTPVGTDQTIDVTGFTKVKVTPAAAATVARCTFTAVAGVAAGDDYLRNGELIIEAGNTNLTLVHNFGAANGMRLKAGVNLVMAQGQIIRLMRSSNYTAGVAGWVEC